MISYPQTIYYILLLIFSLMYFKLRLRVDEYVSMNLTNHTSPPTSFPSNPSLPLPNTSVTSLYQQNNPSFSSSLLLPLPLPSTKWSLFSTNSFPSSTKQRLSFFPPSLPPSLPSPLFQPLFLPLLLLPIPPHQRIGGLGGRRRREGGEGGGGGGGGGEGGGGGGMGGEGEDMWVNVMFS